MHDEATNPESACSAAGLYLPTRQTHPGPCWVPEQGMSAIAWGLGPACYLLGAELRLRKHAARLHGAARSAPARPRAAPSVLRSRPPPGPALQPAPSCRRRPRRRRRRRGPRGCWQPQGPAAMTGPLRGLEPVACPAAAAARAPPATGLGRPQRRRPAGPRLARRPAAYPRLQPPRTARTSGDC